MPHEYYIIKGNTLCKQLLKVATKTNDKWSKIFFNKLASAFIIPYIISYVKSKNFPF